MAATAPQFCKKNSIYGKAGVHTQVGQYVKIIKDEPALDLVEVPLYSMGVNVVQLVTPQKKVKQAERYLIKRLRFRCHGLFDVFFFQFYPQK